MYICMYICIICVAYIYFYFYTNHSRSYTLVSTLFLINLSFICIPTRPSLFFFLFCIFQKCMLFHYGDNLNQVRLKRPIRKYGSYVGER